MTKSTNTNSPATCMQTHSQIHRMEQDAIDRVWDSLGTRVHAINSGFFRVQVCKCDCHPGTKQGLSGLSHHAQMRRQQQMTPATPDRA